MNVRTYESSMHKAWDEFVDRARNSTFILQRDYLEYHADRFTDRSLVFYDRHDKIVGLLPANLDGKTLCSHGGLTYGGLIVGDKGSGAPDVLEMFVALKDYCLGCGIERLVYKPVPHIFHRYPAEEDAYALFRMGAAMNVCNISSTVDLNAPIGFDMAARQDLRRALKAGIRAVETDDYDTFWALLSDELAARYNASPVHSLEEIRRLSATFPDNIRLVGVYADNKMVAGSVVYLSPTCVHTQYTAANDEGRRLRVQPLLTDAIIRLYGTDRRYLDFGTSNEDQGRKLNTGLINKKIAMGGRGIAYTSWLVDFNRPMIR